MQQNPEYIKAVERNCQWFKNSGVMLPADGSWGVAERIAITAGNSAADHIMKSFPACSRFDDYMVVEQRRSDCCFQTAWMMLLAAENDLREYQSIAENLLYYLYSRSGLLNYSYKEHPLGVWNWSHIRWFGVFWMDDNGWVAILQMLLAKKYPELDKRFGLKKWAEPLLEELNRVACRCQDADGNYVNIDPEHNFNGDIRQPHWGALLNLALLCGSKVFNRSDWQQTAERYLDYMVNNLENFNNSESAYASLLFSTAALLLKTPRWREGALACGRKMVKSMQNPYGIPAAEHSEAPTGGALLDTIYTANWMLLGLQSLKALDEKNELTASYQKLLDLIVNIQDRSPQAHLNGCWRGMYDCQNRQWGGGDCYEGGANSIYTGWTNAPIAATIAMELLQTSLAEELAK